MLRVALRTLLRRPAAPAMALLTLALGLAISTALFTVTRDVVLRPFPFRDQDRVLAIWSHIPTQSVPHLELTLAEVDEIRNRSKTLEDVATFSGANFNVVVNTPDPVQVKANFVSKTFYRLLGARAERGRLFVEAEHAPNGPRAVLISHRLWTSLFGRRAGIVGAPIDVEGDKFTVAGVLPPELDLPAGADIIFTLEPFMLGEDARHNSVLEGIGRMRPGVTREAVDAELNTIGDAIAKAYPKKYDGVRKYTLPMVEEILGTTRPAMKTLFVMALLVLAIATFNAASLFVARAVARQRDTAIRVALGASRFGLLRETLAETLLISTAAAVLGFVLAKLAVAALVAAGPDTIPRLHQASVSGTTYLFTAAAAIAVALVCAIVATRRPSSPRALVTSAPIAHSRRLLTTLAGIQLAVALVLLVGAALMIRSFLAVASIDAGFTRDSVVTAHLPLPGAKYGDANVRKKFFADVVERLRSQPGIEAAGAVLIRPLELELGWDWTHTAEGQSAAEQEKNPLGNLISVTPGYLEAMAVPLLRGRLITEHDTDKAQMVIVVGRAFAMRHWGTVDVLGKRVKAGKVDSDRPWRTIVGVVGDVRYRGLTTEKLDVYFPYLQSPWTPQYVAVRTSGSPASAEATLRSIVRSIDRGVPVASVRTTAQLIDAKLAAPRLNASILGTFAAVALLLSMIGVYAVLSYAVRNRTTEMGVRLALGARSPDLLRLVVRDAVVVSAIAAGAGCVAAIALTRFLGSFLHGVSRAEPATLAAACAIVVAAAIAGSLVPAMRAARTEPMNALRDE